MSSILEQFEVAEAALEQVRRLDGICRALAKRTDNLIPRTLPDDLFMLSRLGNIIRRLPESVPGEDITLSIFDGLDPRQSYKRLQFGPRVIELGELQVCAADEGRDDWARMRVFGALLGMGSGCAIGTELLELEQWVDELASQCTKPTTFWRIEMGRHSLGHEHYPSHLGE